MLPSIVIFAVTYLLIASEKVDKAVAAVLGAAAAIALHLIPYEEALRTVDLNVVFLLIGMMMAVNVLAETGAFEWIAISLAQAARGNGAVITLALVLATAVLSAFLDNVTTVILMAPVTILITQILEIPTVPPLILLAVFSNIGGTATLVGDPPNILIGSQTTLTFNDFILNLAPLILLVLAACLLIVGPRVWRSMQASPDMRERIMRAEPRLAIVEPRMLVGGLVVLALILGGFFLGRVLDIEPGIVALAGGVAMVWVCGAPLHRILGQVEWGTVLFFIGLFMLIGSLEHNGVFHLLGQTLVSVTSGNLLATALLLLWVTALASAVVDNIPIVIALIPLVESIVPTFAQQLGIAGSQAAVHARIEAPLFWCLALGACLGGNGTLIGASANVVVAQVARRNRYPLTFWTFTRTGFPLMLVSLAISTAYVYLRYFA